MAIRLGPRPVSFPEAACARAAATEKMLASAFADIAKE
jgi:hypothetical protein